MGCKGTVNGVMKKANKLQVESKFIWEEKIERIPCQNLARFRENIQRKPKNFQNSLKYQEMWKISKFSPIQLMTQILHEMKPFENHSNVWKSVKPWKSYKVLQDLTKSLRYLKTLETLWKSGKSWRAAMYAGYPRVCTCRNYTKQMERLWLHSHCTIFWKRANARGEIRIFLRFYHCKGLVWRISARAF